MEESSEIQAVERVRQIRDEMADHLLGKTEAEVLEFFRQAGMAAREDAVRRVGQTGQVKRTLDSLAEMGTFADIADPVEWQKTVRQDRPLPGREP